MEKKKGDDMETGICGVYRDYTSYSQYQGTKGPLSVVRGAKGV